MNPYELVLILKTDDEKTVNSVKQLIEEKKSKVTKTDAWGKKTFSYPIQKTDSGYYFVMNLEAEKDVIQDLKRKLDYNEDILRYLLLSSN